MQYVIIGMVLLISLLLQCVYRPWKSSELNILETIILLTSLCMTFLSFGLCPAISDSKQKVFMYLLTGVFFSSLVFIVIFFGVIVKIAYGDEAASNKVKLISQSLHPTILSLAIVPEEEQFKFIRELSWIELQSVFDFVDVFGPCLETSRSLASKIAVERPEVNALRKMYSEIRTRSNLSGITRSTNEIGSKTLETSANGHYDPAPGSEKIEASANAFEASANADYSVDIAKKSSHGSAARKALEEQAKALEESAHALRALSSREWTNQDVILPLSDPLENMQKQEAPSMETTRANTNDTPTAKERVLLMI